MKEFQCIEVREFIQRVLKQNECVDLTDLFVSIPYYWELINTKTNKYDLLKPSEQIVRMWNDLKEWNEPT